MALPLMILIGLAIFLGVLWYPEFRDRLKGKK